MKFRRLQFPGKTLIVSSLDTRYGLFALYFLNFWIRRFNERPEFCTFGDTETNDAALELAIPVSLPETFWARFLALRRAKYKTIIFLNPDAESEKGLRWAARLALIRHRVGFAPMRSFNLFNYSLPFNTENHHYVHQLKLFFEYLSGEKIREWSNPDIPTAIPHKTMLPIVPNTYGIIAIDANDDATPHLLTQLTKLINIVTRDMHCIILIRAGENANREDTTQLVARQLSETMTERALTRTELIGNAEPDVRHWAIAGAAWITGTDASALNRAALMGVPGLSIFGPLNERIWQPFGNKSRALTGEFSCRPCSRYPGKTLCTNPVEWQCVSKVSGELLSASLNGMLRRTTKLPKQPPK
jgi:ADP-heptose:LPS heptosyltransferase